MIKPLIIGDLTAKIPLVQGGMGVGVSLSGLASAVAKIGGIGTISGVQIGFREPDFAENPVEANLRAMQREIAKAKENSENIIAVNLMTAMRNYELYVKHAVKCGADIIVSGAGLPLSLPKFVEGSKAKIIPIISSARAAAIIMKAWRKHNRLPDAIVLEGPLAGGHLGFKLDEIENKSYSTLEELIPQIKETISQYEREFDTKIPLIAGGGIYSQSDVDRVLNLGADAVQIGTKMIATQECDASDEYKKAFINAKESDMRIIKSPVGLPARAIANDFLKRAYEEKIPVKKCYGCMAKCSPTEIPFCISKYLVDVVQGKEGLVFSGANGYKIDKISTVKEIVKELFPEVKMI